MKKVKLSLCMLLMAVFSQAPSFSQKLLPLFKDGDRVCYIGSSIAMNGAHFHYINLFYATHYPDQKVTFINSGISGDATDNIISRLESDIISQHPTWAVLMLEENDLNPSLYYKEASGDPDILKKRQKALENWFNNADTIIRKLQNAQIKVILETPTIYDQTGNLSGQNAYGLNDALQKCVIHLKSLAGKYKLPIVDCWTILLNDNKKVQSKDITQSLIGHDRVHVSKYGYLVMAYQFLSHLPGSKSVSTITIDAKQNKVGNSNCTVSNLVSNSKNISFTYLGKSLPFPSPEGLNVDSLHPFTEELNAEIVKVKELSPGNYKLWIDSILTGTYTSSALEDGINLSKNKYTPQYKQAEQVLDVFNAYWKTERTLRIIKYVEYQHHLNRLKNSDDMEEVKKKFTEILEENKSGDNYGFFKNVFDIYLSDKPKEKDLERQSETLMNSIRKANIPVNHSYKIEQSR